LQTATLAYEKNLAAYRQKMADPTPAQIAAAEAKVANAQQQVDDLLAGAEANEVAAAQITVEQAQAALAGSRDTTALEIGVEQAQLAVEAAQNDLAALVLQAPFAGTVTGVNVARGETVGATPILTLADLSRAQLELYLDETDLDKLAVGNQVEVIFDAWPGLPFTGRVSRIDPGLVTVDGVPAISALAELEQPTPAQPSHFADGPSGPAVKLVLGMNAAVEVIAGRAEDALLVPVEALRELGAGQYAVFVLVEGQPSLRPVVVGLQDLTYAEILEGLEQGEVVTTGTVATE
jgi:multidrug efflux pump subunit AcrA (membrane-fusion protein)